MTDQNQPIEFTVGEQTYSLKLGFWAICELERTYDRGIHRVMTEVFGKQTKMEDFLTMFHACMLTGVGNKPIEDVSRQETAALIDELGIDRVTELLGKAIDQCPFFRKSEPKPKRVRGAGPAKKAKSK